MRQGIPNEVIHSSHSVRTVVESWRGGSLLESDLPLETGQISVTANGNVPAQIDLTFPSAFAPKEYTDPLAIYGQRLRVTQVLGQYGQEYPINLGWFLIQGWDHQPPSVSVQALSLEALLDDARFTSPYVRPSGATYASTLRALCRGILPVYVDSGLSDRSLPSSLTEDWEEDRMSALRSIQSNWPCDLRVDDDGILVASRERSIGTPVVEWTHGEANSYVTAGGGALRNEIYNGVVARGETADGRPIQSMAYDNNPQSPTFYNGPFGAKPRFYESPLITTVAQARSAAQSILKRELRRTASVTVTAPPDPRVEMLDTARVTTADGVVFTGLVTEISLPLTPLDGEATYVVSQGGD